jgi:hypothetical protein
MEQVIRLSLLILGYWLVYAYVIGYRIYLEAVRVPYPPFDHLCGLQPMSIKAALTERIQTATHPEFDRRRGGGSDCLQRCDRRRVRALRWN